MGMTRAAGGFRRETVLRGDTLQRIAYRALGDAARWYELADINQLSPPYIASEPGSASARVLAPGATILVPASASAPSAISAEDLPYLADMKLSRGRLVLHDGDFGTIEGLGNLGQALRNRLETGPGEILFHGKYGCSAREVVGRLSNPIAAAMVSGYVKRALLADPRVTAVSRLDVRVAGDEISVRAEVVAIGGDVLPVEAGGGVPG